MLPTIKLGNYEVSRLMIGGNPFSGNSHISADVDEAMENYYTADHIKKALFRAEECGINTLQVRGDKHIFRILREYYNEGGKLQWIAQTASEFWSFEGNVSQIVKNNPIAIYHHGTRTDSLFKNEKYAELEKSLNIIRRSGKLVGLATHMPEVIEYAEEHNWDIDFYMACVHNISKVDRVSSAITGLANTQEPFDDEDRQIMYATIRGTSKPCLAFKILGAGRKCGSSETIRTSFVEAYANIKPIDAVIVGMYQKTKDQVYENTQIVKEILLPDYK